MNLPTPTISVVINNYNYGAFLADAIDSVLNQDLPALEIIVVDDGSTDHSKNILSSYGDKIICLFQENLGQSCALNSGVARSKGDIICLLDADDFFLPNKISILSRLFSEELSLKKPVLISHYLQIVDSLRNPTGGSLPVLFKNIKLHKLEPTPLLQRISNQTETLAFVQQYSMPPFLASPASGLSFNRALAQRLFPLPYHAKIKTVGDELIVRGAMLCADNYCYQVPLGQYRVHQNNLWFSRGQGSNRKYKFNLAYSESWLNSLIGDVESPVRVDYASSLDAMWDHVQAQDIRQLLTMPLKFFRRGFYKRNILGALYSIWSLLRILLLHPHLLLKK
jgi:glycosyltransferase involved in cell wall biosynthesis